MIYKKLTIKTGFTLIEILVVLSIIGIISTMGLSSYNKSLVRGRDAKRKADLANIQKALEIYKQDQSPWTFPANGSWKTDLVNGGYLKKTPQDPAVTNYAWPDYSYTRNVSDNLRFILYACLEDLNDPGADDVDGGVEDRCASKGVSYTITEP